MRRATVPASSTSGTRKRAISVVVRIRLCVWSVTTRSIRLGLREVVLLHTKDVDHSRSPMNLEELLTSRVSRMGKPTVELFAMSYCPYAVKAEEKLIPIVKAFGDKIDFRLRFIAEEKGAPTAQDVTPFRSLHGYPEVAEDIRQLLIAEEYPDRYLDYILCRGKKLEKSWEDMCTEVGYRRVTDTSVI